MNGEIASRLGHLTLDDAIDIALHRNPAILTSLQEIQRTFGVVIKRAPLPCRNSSRPARTPRWTRSLVGIAEQFEHFGV